MPDRNIGIRVDEELYRQIKIRIAEEGLTLKDYILELIKKDLEEKSE